MFDILLAECSAECVCVFDCIYHRLKFSILLSVCGKDREENVNNCGNWQKVHRKWNIVNNVLFIFILVITCVSCNLCSRNTTENAKYEVSFMPIAPFPNYFLTAVAKNIKTKLFPALYALLNIWWHKTMQHISIIK